MFFCGILVIAGLIALCWVAYGTRRLGLGKRQRQLAKLQSRLIEESSDDLCRDLKLLVDGNLAIKRFEVADFYSAKLLELSSQPEDKHQGRLAEPMWSTDYWLSTPEYHKSARYFLLGEARGSLMMTARTLRFVSKKKSLELDLADVRDVQALHHPQWLRPVHLLYLSLSYMDNGKERTVYLSPETSELDPLGKTNHVITQWKQRIIEARDKRIASRTIEKMQDKLNQTGLRAPEIH